MGTISWYHYLIILVLIIVVYYQFIPKKNKSSLLDQASAINDYFADALLVWIFKDNNDAKIAAITAGKVADSIQRASMINYAKGMGEDALKLRDKESKNIKKKYDEIVKILQQKDWTIDDILIAKKELEKNNHEMLVALNNSDGKYFRNKYSSLFENY